MGLPLVHLNLCKRILGVKKRICKVYGYSELGRFSLQTIGQLWGFKYWLKLRNATNCMLWAI